MRRSDIPAFFPERYVRPGTTVQISNMASPCAPPDDRYVYEGEVKEISASAEYLLVTFLWLAQKTEQGWSLVEDPQLLVLRHSLELLASVMVPDDGRLLFLPVEPIVHDQILIVAGDYLGPTGRTPLKRSEVQKL